MQSIKGAQAKSDRLSKCLRPGQRQDFQKFHTVLKSNLFPCLYGRISCLSERVRFVDERTHSRWQQINRERQSDRASSLCSKLQQSH